MAIERPKGWTDLEGHYIFPAHDADVVEEAQVPALGDLGEGAMVNFAPSLVGETLLSPP
jgi:hypothetical protein